MCPESNFQIPTPSFSKIFDSRSWSGSEIFLIENPTLIQTQASIDPKTIKTHDWYRLARHAPKRLEGGAERLIKSWSIGRAYRHVVHRIKFYALVNFEKKNVGWHKTLLNIVMESFYLEIVLSEDFYKLID